LAYKDFKSYIQANYKDLLKEEILKYVNRSHDGLGFHHINVLSLCNQDIENVTVRTLTCHDDIGPLIKIDVHASADIVTKGLGTSNYDADRKTRWFTVYLKATLQDGLHNVTALATDEYHAGQFDKEGALDEYLVPYIYADDLEEIADDFTAFYCDDDVYDGWQSPLNRIMQEMGLKWYEADLGPNEMGRMYFRPSTETVEEFYPPYQPRTVSTKEIPAGTMLISKDYFFMNGYGSRMDTIAHEIVHWDQHEKFFKILALLNADEKNLSCEAVPASTPDNLEGMQKARWWAEWQANALAPRILMPRRIFNDLFPKLYEEQLTFPYKHTGEVMERALEAIAGVFKVSKLEAKLRALQLGYKDAEGAFLRVNGHPQVPFSFYPDALGDYQTFILNNKNGSRIYSEDKQFADLIDSGRFVYTGCVVCINDPCYIYNTDDPAYPQGYALTDYALEHVDECCLKFTRHYTVVNSAGDYYNQCYLSKDVNAAEFTETRTIEYEGSQNVLEQEKQLSKIDDQIDKIMDVLPNLPTSFWGTLDAHMKRVKKKGGKKITNLELQYRTGISERYIRQLRQGPENVSPEYVYGICIGLHLHPLYSDDMVKKAIRGYPMTKDGMFAQYLLHNHFTESLTLINEKLRKQGYPTWGDGSKIVEDPILG